ncbi:MAG: dihydroorotate dehydrogenase electron transfer subunit [Candidatus Magasanikbacteria bacterium]|nr:dihydroorotate dehydrogenase electron transfer subunit [Candidatus Magasanikbacteria bacterium]
MKDILPDVQKTLPIKNITNENPHVKTFWFEHTLHSKPGQFVMLWIPGLDQKPFSISYDYGDKFGLSIFSVGPLSSVLFNTTKVGDKIGITGPYGKSFSTGKHKHYIAVGGGYGSGPLGFLAEILENTGVTLDFCVGAKNKDLLLFEERAARLSHVSVHVATDDGSKGHKGYVTELLEDILKKRKDKKDIIVSACGPELMEKTVLDLANAYDVNCELSIERYMKCGFGICGQCSVDPLGIPLCTEGPVLSKDTANKLTEFGAYHRNKCGGKEYYKPS